MYRKTIPVRNWLLALLVCLACSCNNDRLETPGTDGTTYTYPMHLQGGCGTFDDEASTRAPYVWADDDVIYLRFQVGSKVVRGEALYDFDADLWTVTASEALPADSEGACTSVFIHNPASVSGTKVQLSQQSVVYRDEQSSYLVQDGELTVTGLLLPQTGRIQLRGAANTSFTLSGLSFLTAYDTAGDSFTQAPSKFTATTQADGRTPYYYATFAEEAKRELTFTLNSSVALRRSFGTAVLSTGESGYITIPTMESHEGWEEVKNETLKTITVNGVSFNMVLVEKGTFMMGGTEYSGEKPIHSVSLTKSYYIGETEVTQELYQAVMGSNPSYYLGTQRPVECVSWNDCQTFITKLNSLTGLTFRLPTEAEWEFAARGGNLSKGYLYSGSSTIGDVAWYLGNSENVTHEIKNKKTNELGLYDMSGNVWEWCQDRYGNYSADSQIDPKGSYSGKNRVLRGGCWCYDAMACRVVDRIGYAPSTVANNGGFRLALTDPQEESDVTGDLFSDWFNPNQYITYVANPYTKYSGDNMYEYASNIDCPMTIDNISKIEMKYQMKESVADAAIYLSCENWAKDACDVICMSNKGMHFGDDEEEHYLYSWEDLNHSITDCMVLTTSFKDNYIKLNGVELEYIMPSNVTFSSKVFFCQYFSEYDEGRYTSYRGVPEGSKLYYIKIWDENDSLIYLGAASTALNPKTNKVENCWRSYCNREYTYEFAFYTDGMSDYQPYGGGIDFSNSQIDPTPSPIAEAIDLGLSVKWASCNVGATAPEEYGGYYAWGETEEKEDYSWETYKWCNGSYGSITKYCTEDNKTVLDFEDDVAHVKWGGNWRMPTLEEFRELVEKCTWTWTTQNGVAGYNVSASNGNRIFLPAAGDRSSTGVYNCGSYGYYWCIALGKYDSRDAYQLYFDHANSYWDGWHSRYDGFTVRPVAE